MGKYILAVFAQNKPGVLSRISGLLRRKLFQIDSLTVGRTSDPGISRFTIVIEGGVEEADKTARTIEKLVEVLSVEILPPEDSVLREIVLARFRLHNKAEEKLLYEAEKSVLAKEIAREGDTITVELVDSSYKLEAFLEKIQNSDIEILDWVRSGVIAMKRGD